MARLLLVALCLCGIAPRPHAQLHTGNMLVDLLHVLRGDIPITDFAQAPMVVMRPLALAPRETNFVGCRNCPCDICDLGGLERGMFAPVESHLFMQILRGKCEQDGKKQLVVDVGANVGYFTLLSASFGCRVMSFEPQPMPRALIAASLSVNSFTHDVTVVPYAIAASKGTGSVFVGGPWWGLNKIKEGDTGSGIPNLVPLEMRPLDEFVKEDVLLLKVDTEGYEKQVVEGALPLLRTYKVHNVIMEIKHPNTAEKREMIRTLMNAAGLSFAYNYEEDYMFGSFFQEGGQLKTRIVDVTATVTDASKDSVALRWEDFVFTRVPWVL